MMCLFWEGKNKRLFTPDTKNKPKKWPHPSLACRSPRIWGRNMDNSEQLPLRTAPPAKRDMLLKFDLQTTAPHLSFSWRNCSCLYNLRRNGVSRRECFILTEECLHNICAYILRCYCFVVFVVLKKGPFWVVWLSWNSFHMQGWPSTQKILLPPLPEHWVIMVIMLEII